MNSKTQETNKAIKGKRWPTTGENVSSDGEIDTPERNEADITPEDLEALGPKDLSMDGGDDEQLKHRTHPVNFSGDDLDIPGAELDDEEERVGSEDEENNAYSIGGDNHENLEEDHS